MLRQSVLRFWPPGAMLPNLASPPDGSQEFLINPCAPIHPRSLMRSSEIAFQDRVDSTYGVVGGRDNPLRLWMLRRHRTSLPSWRACPGWAEVHEAKWPEIPCHLKS